MKRILFINDYVVGGGVEKVLSDLVLNLPKEKYDITVGFMIPNSPYSTMYGADIKCIKIANTFDKLIDSSSISARIINKIYKFITIKKCKAHVNKQFDIVVAFKEGPCMEWISTLRKPKKLGWIHVDYRINHWTKGMFYNNRNLEIDCMNKFEHIICVSEGVRQGVIDVLGEFDNLRVCYNPLDITNILIQSQEEVMDIKREEDKLLLLSVGRLVHQKGYIRLFHIISRLNQEFQNYEVWIIGEGEDLKHLQQLKLELKLDNIKLLGNKTNPYKYMKMADWNICSSYYEGFSTVLQEATILGVPILTTDCAGSKELLGKNNEYGIVVENTDEALEAGLREILNKRALLPYYRKCIEERKDFIDLNKRMDNIIQYL